MENKKGGSYKERREGMERREEAGVKKVIFSEYYVQEFWD